jgi:hypothetical protein
MSGVPVTKISEQHPDRSAREAGSRRGAATVLSAGGRMADPAWFWHRLKAMSPAELYLRARKRGVEYADARRSWAQTICNLTPTEFPRLPAPAEAPVSLQRALGASTARILAGSWEVFEGLPLRVNDPPNWHCDYLVGRDLRTRTSGFRLDHRSLPGGADVKLIWELSRWHELVRLAMAAYVLGDRSAADKCLAWLEDWVAVNLPYMGWNWTSALEVGLRLIQFAWIDSLLEGCCFLWREGRHRSERLNHLREQMLPPHLWYTWRHRSFGSSANNHLLGELAGCIVALTRWPGLAQLGISLPQAQSRWEAEVVAQFHPDGGNREQALNYHLFGFELCWQALKALEVVGRPPADAVRERLALAAAFYREVQVPSDPWDYGDSDGAFVTSFFAERPVPEWHRWFADPTTSPAITYWLGTPPSGRSGSTSVSGPSATWRIFSDTGVATRHTGDWTLRWDVSPLGYQSTAAHGHLDALHLSLWLRGIAVVVDPGTGAYFADDSLRAWLASRAAHNSPCPAGPQRPARRGPFLWDRHHHPVPSLEVNREGVGIAILNLWGTRLRRKIAVAGEGEALHVYDQCQREDGHRHPFVVRWQFAPDSRVVARAERTFRVDRSGAAFFIQVDHGWSAATIGQGVVSPGFRQVVAAPYLELTAGPGPGSADLQTTFALDERL